ncbi:AbgT family transporter [Ketobacter sp. MCCC 1A13808]|uniref:AbgT family transporter n=1 Tax=Ketobacter sp. MCCC 1A13808 TaxID=2602738 RepID=UPI000F25BF82|nr:AbgT family transporter [Ketobacter sp. MCCC 1A13808]MVF12603.1 AbgT family transporter [Ketobacter sp. MCCC 1A13808]RLP55598.1 MAG: AbgT family transporter [Ketobacter sp.]
MADDSWHLRLLNRIELAGNRLPHPTALFIYFSLFVLALSWLLSFLGISAQHPTLNQTIIVTNLISQQGLHRILESTVTNFTQFAPVGTVLIAMLGLGIAEKSGLLAALLKRIVGNAKGKLLSATVVFAGVMSSLAADAGYVVLIPLAGIIFASAGKHPLAGMAAAFAGVSGGYSANLLVGPIDAVLAGISTEAAQLVDSSIEISVLSNYYFIIASTVFITIAGTWITEKVTLPALPSWAPTEAPVDNKVTLLERRGLRQAGIMFMVCVALIILGLVPDSGLLRDPETHSIARSPFVSGIVSLISLIAALSGIVFGVATGRYHRKGSVIEDMEATMATMASYLVLMFFAAQFINYFAWSNIGLILAITGANWLQNLALSPVLLLSIFILMSAFINLLIGSASAKWSLLAPIFIPMFLLLGIAPEQVQAAYRVGDSSTNIITPLMPYFGVVVAFMQRYDKDLGVGTIVSLMLPYSVMFLIFWSILFAIWMVSGFAFGPLS